MKWIEQLKARAAGMKKDVLALALAFRDQRTPWYAKAFTVLVVAYALSPIDLIPDFIPVLGYLDDLILVPLGVWTATRMIPAQVMVESRQQADRIEGSSSRLRYLGLALMVAIWLLALFLVAKAIF